VPIRWSVPQHGAALERLLAALDAGGAVVLGPDGVGKSTLARLAAEHFVDRHPGTVVRWVTGTPTERAVPFGAFSHLVGIADIGKPAALLRAARASLGAGADDVLIIDDANLLDPLSATLVYQLALAGQTRMIVTARADVAPHAVAAVWTDGLLERIDIEPTDTATGPEQVDEYVADLPAAARAVLDYLAVQEPLPLADLTRLTSEDAIREAEALGAVEVHPRGVDGEAVVFTAHPLFADRALAALGAAGARRLCADLVPLASARARDHASDRLRVATLAVDSDAPQEVGEVVAATEEALRLGDLALAERLAGSALQRDDNLATRLPLATALAYQGRGREADAVLAAVNPRELAEPELMAWALPRAANQFFMLGEPTRAAAFLQTTRNRVSAPARLATLDGLAATFAMNAGNLERALQIAGEVLASPDADDQAVGWAASAAALSSARMGRFDDVDALAARALAVEHPGLLRFTGGFGRITALLMAGRLAEARTLAQEFTNFAELQQPGRAIGEVLVAYVAIAQGDLDDAVTLLGPAADALETTGYSWGPLSLMLLAQALGQRRELKSAATALARAESRHGLKSALFAPELSLAKAWSRAARNDMPHAIDGARDAAQAAERGGQSAIAVRALHDAVRLGDTLAVYRLERLAGQADCAVARLALAHARALTAADAPALEAVSRELADVGLRLAADDAAAQAQLVR
jgi:energy-coupling factor transporter ATP-binding protein EcfA2